MYLISDLCAALLVVPGSTADLGNHHRVQQDPGGLLFVDPSGKFLEVVLLGHKDLPACVSQLLPNCPPKSLLQTLVPSAPHSGSGTLFHALVGSRCHRWVPCSPINNKKKPIFYFFKLKTILMRSCLYKNLFPLLGFCT